MSSDKVRQKEVLATITFVGVKMLENVNKQGKHALWHDVGLYSVAARFFLSMNTRPFAEDY